jgi:hypothetical protein
MSDLGLGSSCRSNSVWRNRIFNGNALTLQMKSSGPQVAPAAQLRIAGRNLRLVGAFSTGSLSTMSPRPKTIWAL